MNPISLAWRLAAYGLPGRDGRLNDEPLDPPTWRRFLAEVDEQRLAGWLLAAIDDGALAATDAQRDDAASLHLAWCGRCLRLEGHLLHVAAALEAHGLDLVVLKGPALARLAYPDVERRLFGDIDLLVRSVDLERALDVLADLGHTRAVREPRPGFDRRFGKGVTLGGPNGEHVDVHRTLLFGTYGFAIELDELFRAPASFELGGRSLSALGPETRFLHACYHAALGDPRPRCSSVRDVAQLMFLGEHDDEQVLALIHAWHAEAVVARALDLCQERLGLRFRGPVVAAVSGYEPRPRDRRAIASYVGRNRGFATQVVASLPYLDGVLDRAAFLRAAVLPTASAVESRGTEPGLPWIRRGLRSLRHGAGR